ncbi:NAD(P)H-binding protein [Millisia brevis]|uniref:NAD(P)H-binding protein n=1 Tax=Millisia brevis TaxID=264148 RepID=UPI000837A318|nr:NAD(P)H-binding protein [Millisia brevis]
MSHIVELSPALNEAGRTDFTVVHGIWNASDSAASLAAERGHRYIRPDHIGLTDRDIDDLLIDADALVLAPTVATPTGMWLPVEGETAGRTLGHRLLDRIAESRPDLHIVLVSHFLVGHGVAHRNARTSTWSLRALEAHLRGGPNPWTILRPTWVSTIHDESYRTRLTRDANADGLVSTAAVADTVLTAIENPAVAAGRTAAVYNLSIPETGTTDLIAEFSALEADLEAGLGVATQPLVGVERR